jgi:tetratricopeptide (TPR) repeat protein
MDNADAGQVDLTPQLIEREEELGLLRRKMDEAKEGSGSVILLSGEAGMGKTRLAEEAEREARERGMLFLRGSGDARRAGLAYGIFVEELEVYLEHVSAAERSELRQAVAELAPHLWGSVFPTELPPEEEPEMAPELRQGLFLARLGRLLLDLTRRQPIVLCLEDLHWADSASLQMLGFLANRNAEVSMVILCTFRPGEEEGKDRIDLEKTLRELQLKNHCYAPTLKPLSPKGTREMVVSCLTPHAFSKSFFEWLYGKSSGVPLFVIQYLEFLLEKGGIHRKKELWVGQPPREKQDPESVRAVLRQRLERLTPEERQILSFASVQGDRFEGRLLARTLGSSFTGVMRILGGLTRRTRLVRIEDRQFRFAHSLLTEVFYEALSESRRAQIHARLGGILEEQKNGDAEVLAFHFYHAGAFAHALPHLLEAARRAQSAFAYREAKRFLLQAKTAMEGLDRTDVRHAWFEVLLRLAEIEDRTGDPETSLALCRQVLSEAGKDEVQVTGQALKLMAWVEYRKGNWEASIELHWDAQGIFADLGDEEQLAIVYIRLGNIAYERSNYEEAGMRFRDAMHVGIKNSNYPLLGTVHGNLAVLATVRGQFVDAVLGYINALNAYRKVGHTYGLCQTYHNLGMAHAAQEEWDEALRCYQHGLQLASEMGTIDVEASILVTQSVAQLRAGSPEDAATSCQTARIYMEKLGDRLGLAECDKVEGMICGSQEQYQEAEEHLSKGRHLFEALENRLGVAECELELGRLLQNRGEVGPAKACLRESQRLFNEIGAEANAREAEELLTGMAS